MKVNMRRLLRYVCVWLLIWSAVVAGLIIFGTAKPPDAATAITEPFSAIDVGALPELLRYKARDGARLSYREYRATGTRVAVLLHGSAGSSVDMHPLALALQRAGTTALVPDLRGHGANRPHGDIAYVGQLDDDLADFIINRKPQFAQSTWTILGFSSGAAFGLRFGAESPAGQLVDRYVLVSPYLRYNAPSIRHSEPGAAAPQSWAAVSTGRIIGLTFLNHFGVHCGTACRCSPSQYRKISIRRPGPTRGACREILEPTTIISLIFAEPIVLCGFLSAAQMKSSMPRS